MYLLIKNGYVTTTCSGQPDMDDITSRNELLIEAEGTVGDAFIDGLIYKKPGLFYTFDMTAKDWVFDLASAKSNKLNMLAQSARQAILGIFPDTAKAQSIRDQEASTAVVINNVTTSSDLDAINITFVI